MKPLKTLVSSIEVLEDVRHSYGWNHDTVTDATTLLSAITAFEFLIGFVVAWKALTLVKPLSMSLQLSSIDICKAYQYVSKTRKSVQHVHDNVDDFNSNGLILLKVNQRLLVLMDHQYLDVVDDKEAEVIFLLKNQLSTTEGQL